MTTAYYADLWPRRRFQSRNSIVPASQHPPRLFEDCSSASSKLNLCVVCHWLCQCKSKWCWHLGSTGRASGTPTFTLDDTLVRSCRSVRIHRSTDCRSEGIREETTSCCHYLTESNGRILLKSWLDEVIRGSIRRDLGTMGRVDVKNRSSDEH